MYVHSAWYVGAWDHEVTRALKRRIILDEPVLLFRREDGWSVRREVSRTSVSYRAFSAGITSRAKSSMFLRVRSAGSVPN